MIPDELIFHIFQFLSPSEVIPLRLVSKRFSVLSRDTQLWRTLYASARLPRPPGPFLWQSTRSLERTLVHSERVARTWTPQSVNIVSRINGPTLPITSPWSAYAFLFGRLLIWYDEGQVLSEDIETGHRQVVWNGDLRIVSIRACPLLTPDGLRVLLAVSRANYSPEHDKQDPQSKLLVFSLDDDTSSTLGPVTHEMNLPAGAWGFHLSFTPSLLYFDCRHGVAPTVIDLRTYALYKFPPSHFSLPTGTVDKPLMEVVLSGPYIVSLRELETLGTLVQIYVVPTLPSTDSTMGELRLTHETLTRGTLHDPEGVPSVLEPLRDPVVDPLTGDTTLRFLRRPSRITGYKTIFFCVDFTIPATGPSSTLPLPLMFDIRELFVVHGKIVSVDLYASGDGHGRGIIVSFPDDNVRCECCKFSINASGETCTVVVGDSTSAPGYLFSPGHQFDGVRGRICYRDWIREETIRGVRFVHAKV